MITVGGNWIFDMSIESITFDDGLDEGKREMKESLLLLNLLLGQVDR